LPFETNSHAPKRIAIIGGGISGMAAAYHLSMTHSVTLYEAEPRIGGHARTVLAGKAGDQPVDTGFIVYNHANYPNLTRLFDELDVPIAKSNMSFGASIGGGRLEYGLKSLDALFAQRRNALSPAFLRMVRDILRFNKNADAAEARPDISLGDFCDNLGLGQEFKDWYLAPMTGAIWSTPTQNVMAFPAQALIKFFRNHALMSATGQHQWYTVQGGSIEYVRRLETALLARAVEIRKGTPVAAVTRTIGGGAQVKADGAEWQLYDEVVFATHSDQALALLHDATPQERTDLGAVRYQPNTATLHADPAVMPRSRKCWASWVYTEQAEKTDGGIDLTYWMNSLQPIPQDDLLLVTLNSRQPIRPELIYDEVTFAHPVYDVAMMQAVERIKAANGTGNTWFCGAWMRNGFHEDGYASAMDVVEGLSTRDAALAAE
jgi:predicted NAD/FAD-binding protein